MRHLALAAIYLALLAPRSATACIADTLQSVTSVSPASGARRVPTNARLVIHWRSIDLRTQGWPDAPARPYRIRLHAEGGAVVVAKLTQQENDRGDAGVIIAVPEHPLEPSMRYVVDELAGYSFTTGAGELRSVGSAELSRGALEVPLDGGSNCFEVVAEDLIGQRIVGSGRACLDSASAVPAARQPLPPRRTCEDRARERSANTQIKNNVQSGGCSLGGRGTRAGVGASLLAAGLALLVLLAAARRR